MNEVTRILSAIEQGDPHAAEKLLPLVYEELRRLAADKMAKEKPGQTLQATALVHEAYLRLVTSRDQGEESSGDASEPASGVASAPRVRHWKNSRHFFAAAAEAMRHILVDRARSKRSQKRGGDRTRLEFDEAHFAAGQDPHEVLAVDEAMAGLARADPQAAELVKLRYFAGLSIPEAAKSLGISARSADRLWTYARAWLRRAIGES
jgi:RNA polymerase sigma factor (sigma-70 family)